MVRFVLFCSGTFADSHSSGFASFIIKFKYKTFITSYIGVVSYIALILGWKFVKGSTKVGAATVDLMAGRITKEDCDRAKAEETMVGGNKSTGLKRVITKAMHQIRIRL
jgi:amino acid permease